MSFLFCLFFVLNFFCVDSLFCKKNNHPFFEIDYISNRVDRHVQALYRMNQKQSKFFETILKKIDIQEVQSSPQTLSISGQNYSFFVCQHELMKWCVKKIMMEKSLYPLFDVWEDFKLHQGFDSNDDFKFLHECALFIFSLYNNILIEVAPTKRGPNHHLSAVEIASLFQKIAALPIGDLLDILDQILEELTSILEEYYPDANQSVLSWLSENWWIPPTILAGIVATIILRTS